MAPTTLTLSHRRERLRSLAALARLVVQLEAAVRRPWAVATGRWARVTTLTMLCWHAWLGALAYLLATTMAGLPMTMRLAREGLGDVAAVAAAVTGSALAVGGWLSAVSAVDLPGQM